MSVTVLCHGCGQQVPVPEGHGRPKMRCPACGVMCDVPGATAISAAPLPPVPVGKGSSGRAVQEPLIVGTDEDDGKPYTVPADPDQKTPCPNCTKSVRWDAVVCAHCGHNRQTGETFERVFEKVEKEWEGGLRFPVRLRIFLGVGGFALAATVVVGLAGGDWLGLFISWLIGATLLAYVLGTYPRINLTRNPRGRVRLTRTWRICFIERTALEIRWRRYEGVVVGPSQEADFWDWAILVFLLGVGLIPGVLWWIFMIQPGQFDAALCKGHGFPALILYHGPSQAIAQDIAATVHDVTGLSRDPHF